MVEAQRAATGGGQGLDETISRLREIPNVGPKMAEALLKLGVGRLGDAAGRDPDEMYHELCAREARRLDPCVRDVFAAVVSLSEGHPARPWWEFTPERKARAARDRQAREKGTGEEKA